MVFSASPKISASDLHKPLLGDEEDQQQEQRVVSEELRRCDDEEEASQSPSAADTWCDSILAWFVLPCLLWLDFCLVLRHPAWRQELPVASTAMASIHMSFVMFILSSFLYRKTIDEWAGSCGRTASVALLLVPELAMNVMLVLIFFDRVVAAYLMLLAVILALSLVVVACSAFRLFCVQEVEPAKSRKELSADGDEDDWEVEVQITC
jgi:hypothetical protein